MAIESEKIIMKKNKNIVFYDGYCGLCNRLVIFLLKYERNDNISYCSLQSEFAKSFLKDFNIPMKIETIYYFSEGKLYKRTEAIKKVIRNLKSPFLIIYYIVAITPEFLREYFYKLFAKNRYKWFGKMDDCKIPSAKNKERFLNI